MALRLKPSAESATASEHNVFLWARLKLTAVYVLILGVILLGFSITLYESIRSNLIDANDDAFSSTESHHHFAQNALASVVNEILLIDLIILVGAAGASYVLAGYTLRPIQRSLEAQKIFSENASHELRTPLTVMKSDIEVLLRNPSASKNETRKTLHSAIEEIDRMSGMAKDLLMLARSEYRAALTVEEIDAAELARNVTEKMRVVANRKGITVSTSLADPLRVQGNTADLERVFMNLLQNAIDHTPTGGAITVEATQEKKQAVISITDTGAGIAEKDLPHIFKRFYKGEGTSGSGLGLSIVKELVNRHGGTVAITSIKGEGTTVTIKLPMIV